MAIPSWKWEAPEGFVGPEYEAPPIEEQIAMITPPAPPLPISQTIPFIGPIVEAIVGEIPPQPEPYSTAWDIPPSEQAPPLPIIIPFLPPINLPGTEEWMEEQAGKNLDIPGISIPEFPGWPDVGLPDLGLPSLGDIGEGLKTFGNYALIGLGIIAAIAFFKGRK